MPAQDFQAGSSTPAFPHTLPRGRAPSSSVAPSPCSPHSGLRPDLPFERFSSIRHEGPVSSRDWPADQNHPLQALGTHRLGLVVMNFGTLKRLVELNQAIIPTLWLRARSPWKGQRPIQSPVNSGGKREPSQEPGPRLGRDWAGVYSPWLSLFLGVMAPQYPLGRSQLDDCSRFKGGIGQKEEGSGKDS